MQSLRTLVKYRLAEELQERSKWESCLFPEPEVIDEEYAIDEAVYRYCFGIVLVEKSGLDRLDKRIADKGYKKAAYKDMDFYQSGDLMKMDYFYIFGIARVERLEEQDRDLLRSAMDNEGEEGVRIITELVERTYKSVMAVAPETPDQWYEPIPTIHGDYRVKGSNLLLALKVMTNLNEELSLEDLSSEDLEAEKTRFQVFRSIKNQIEPIISKSIDMPTVVFTELF